MLLLYIENYNCSIHIFLGRCLRAIFCLPFSFIESVEAVYFSVNEIVNFNFYLRCIEIKFASREISVLKFLKVVQNWGQVKQGTKPPDFIAQELQYTNILLCFALTSKRSSFHLVHHEMKNWLWKKIRWSYNPFEDWRLKI